MVWRSSQSEGGEPRTTASRIDAPKICLTAGRRSDRRKAINLVVLPYDNHGCAALPSFAAHGSSQQPSPLPSGAMNSTPRRGPGGFPATPQHPQQQNRSPKSHSDNTSSSTPSRPNVRSPLPNVPKPAAAPASSGPLIPLDILDAPQQRFYVFAVYVAVQSWKIYDFYTLAIEEEQSLAQCLKWCFLDMCLIFGVPLLEIPWLEWSNAVAFLLFVVHAVLDCMLMFRIGLPLTYWLVSLGSFLYDTETAINERSVKPGPILFNASLILGKQIINILPEGYVKHRT